ncbi:MAG: hypothetical protein S0880_17630 [Actinomycetota bacterium]|nr:hypothetical protein [Actinomycetota bacterium]
MTSSGEGWSSAQPAMHPGAALPEPLEPVTGTGDELRVVGIGAVCDLRPPRPDDRTSRSFGVSEFVRLADGRQVTLHAERGFTVGARGRPERRLTLTTDDVVRNVLTTVLPDDDSIGEDHPWAWLASLARARGLDVTEDDLRALDYEIVLTERLRGWLAG